MMDHLKRVVDNNRQVEVDLGEPISCYPFNPKEVADYDPASTAETLEDLEAFTGVIKQYGLSKPLLAFANHNGRLSSVIPELPALESFNQDLSVSQSASVVSAVEGIHRLLLSAWKLRFNIQARIKIQNMKLEESQLAKRIASVRVLNQNVKADRVFSEEKAKAKHVNMLSFQHLIECINAVHLALSAAEAVSRSKMPVTEEEYHTWLASASHAVNAFTKYSGQELNERGKLKVREEQWIGYQKGSLYELGYTNIEQFHTLFDHLDGMLKSYQAVQALEQNLRDHAELSGHDDESLKYLRRVCNIILSVNEHACHYIWWIANTETIETLRHIYACTEQK